MDRKNVASLERTPTWAVAVVCFCFLVVSCTIDAVLRRLTEFLRKRKRKSLRRSLEKIKTEMMIMGFISLLLTILEAPISKICVSEALANSFHPCRDPTDSSQLVLSSAAKSSGSNLNTTNQSFCEARGMVSLMSSEGVMQLKIFISVLAVFHVFYCILTMCLGMAKMRRWKAWEEETRSLEYQIANDRTRFRLIYQTSFGRRHLRIWSNHRLLLWPVCFFRQFSGSASKADYFTLRNGFIVANVSEGSAFNFQKFLARAFDEDFEQVVGISEEDSSAEFYSYYWQPFIPLVLLLAVGTKLETIITEMCVEGCKNNAVVLGTFPVKPSNAFFWFSRPKMLLHLLQIILIQNSFQLAFFVWAWYEYGLRSCFNRETADVAIRITTGVVILFLCGYVTLPINALVTQMGSGMKRAVFTECVTKGLKNWQNKAIHNLASNASTSIRPSTISPPFATDTLTTELQNKNPQPNDLLDPSASMSAPPETTEEGHHDHTPTVAMANTSTQEITKQKGSPKGIAEETHNGEISFRNSWKKPLNIKANQNLR